MFAYGVGATTTEKLRVTEGDENLVDGELYPRTGHLTSTLGQQVLDIDHRLCVVC